ncbi:MAG: MBL fold metallo-hydrolase [bacterium]
MIFKQFYLKSLGHASYFIGSEESGQALVLDVRRDVDTYFQEARSQGMRIAFAADTHQHNDYLSGICELSEHGNIQLLVAARAELGYNVRKLHDGEQVEMGEVVFEIIHTPGHTPEHISLLITDWSRGDEPAMLLSGGALLVGDIGRPDLFDGPEQIKKNVADFCCTLQERILKLPDHVQVYPTHVSGSLCAGGISSRLSTTIGYERRMNKLLASLSSKEEFIEQCMDPNVQLAIPPYWRRMRKLNQQGPPLIGTLREPPALRVDEFDHLRQSGITVLDCRSPEAFAHHIPGAINVGIGPTFSTWAGSVLPEGAAVILVLEDEQDLWEVCWQLLRIGYDLPRGWLSGGMKSWRKSGRELESMDQWTVWQLHEYIEERQENLFLLDVRHPMEWTAGHIAQANYIPGAQLLERMYEVPRHKEVAIVCGTGYRSSVTASLLKSRGYGKVTTVLGGMNGWQAASLPMVT